MFNPQEDTDDNNYDHDFKIVFVGERGVGKTSLICRLVFNTFTSDLPPTLGVSVSEYIVRRNGLRIRAKIWDTPGHQYTSNIARNFFRTADAVVIVFDLTNRQSFLNLDKWCTQILQSTENSVLPFIVGTKCDVEDRLVNNDELSQFAERKLFLTFQTSAVTSVGVKRMMDMILDILLSSMLLNRGFRLNDISRAANRGLSERWSLGRFCCGGLRRFPSPILPNIPARMAGLVPTESAREVRDTATVEEQGALDENPLARDLPDAEDEVSDNLRETSDYFNLSLVAFSNENESTSTLRDSSLKENPRPSIDTSSEDGNPVRVVPPVASAVDPARATPSTSNAVANGGEHDAAHCSSFIVESGTVASLPGSDSEGSLPNSNSDTGSSTSVSSTNDTVAFYLSIASPN